MRNNSKKPELSEEEMSKRLGHNLPIYIADKIRRMPINEIELKRALEILKQAGIDLTIDDSRKAQIFFDTNPYLFYGLETEMSSSALRAAAIDAAFKVEKSEFLRMQLRNEVPSPLRDPALSAYYFSKDAPIACGKQAKVFAKYYMDLHKKFSELFPYFKRGCELAKCKNFKDGECQTQKKYFSEVQRILGTNS